ncbi:MAG: molybdate ABC transporter permease subunit [Verrucomicrobiales bacterium]|nr:molybdate ABC transporter permease subunit [Verrucomicrobiales bacterium]
MLTQPEINALWLTFRLALVTTTILVLLGAPLAWWLARTKWRFQFVIDAIIALPLVLPPTVLGFYLLLAFAPDGPLGKITSALGIEPLAFTFQGLVIGSVLYSLPFVVQPIQTAFLSIKQEQLEVAATLGSSPVSRFFSVVLPMARPGIITGAVLGFAHTLGEFGVVLMIGGNIPDSTRVVSIAIYDQVESLNYAGAHRLSAVLLVISFLLLVIVYGTNRGFRISSS